MIIDCARSKYPGAFNSDQKRKSPRSVGPGAFLGFPEEVLAQQWTQNWGKTRHVG